MRELEETQAKFVQAQRALVAQVNDTKDSVRLKAKSLAKRNTKVLNKASFAGEKTITAILEDSFSIDVGDLARTLSTRVEAIYRSGTNRIATNADNRGKSTMYDASVLPYLILVLIEYYSNIPSVKRFLRAIDID